MRAVFPARLPTSGPPWQSPPAGGSPCGESGCGVGRVPDCQTAARPQPLEVWQSGPPGRSGKVVRPGGPDSSPITPIGNGHRYPRLVTVTIRAAGTREDGIPEGRVLSFLLPTAVTTD